MSAPLSVASRRATSGLSARERLGRAGLVVLLLILLCAGWLLWDNRRLDVTAHEVPVGLPANVEGPRIVQISDLHASDAGDLQDRVLRATEAAAPDLIALTGDLIDYQTADLTAVLEFSASLQALAPTYFVLGNHEADSPLRGELLAGLEERGVVVLRDEAATVEIAGTELVLVGLDDPRVRAADGLPTRVPGEVLAGMSLPEGTLTVLLAHRPELFESYTGHGIDLVLSGHAHGGQVRLPGVGGLYAPHQGLFPELTEGQHEQDGTTMVISRGLGNSIAAVRVLNPRELVIVDLLPRD